MRIVQQIKKLKENWLLIVLFLLVLVFFSYFRTPIPQLLGQPLGVSYDSFAKTEIAAEPAYARGGIYPPVQQDFAPESPERKITKTASISNEVERGYFKDAEDELKSIVKSSKSFILNENVNKVGKGRMSYYTGGYQLQTEARIYDDVVQQLKKIGEVTYFSSNALDVTGTFVSLEAQLEAEKTRLARYKELYNQATKVSDKIELEDRIFNQERTIKYLEEALKNIGEQVEYSAIYVTLTEKQSEYINIAFVKFSELVRRFVASANSVLALLIAIVPYAIALLIVWLAVRLFKKRK